MLWGPLVCVGMRWHSPYYWILLEHIGTTWNLYDPIRTVLHSPGCALPPVPEMHSCTIHSHALGTSVVCWHALAFSLLLDTVGTQWNHLEPIQP